MKPQVDRGRTAEEWCGLLFGGVPRSILFRVDGGCVPGLSFGHLYRCLEVARVVREQGSEDVAFLMRGYPEGVKVAEEAGVRVVAMPVAPSPSEESEAVTSLATEMSADWLVADLPYADHDFGWTRKVRSNGARVLFIDDARFMVPEADVVWNSSILAPGKVSSTEPKARILAGMEYFMFNGADVSAEPIRTEGRTNVLITFGGSDPTGLTLQVIAALRTRPWSHCLFRVILGPGFREGREVREALSGCGDDWSIIENPSSLIPYFLGSDVAVSNGGRTLYEVTLLGRAALPVASTEFEAANVGAFLEQGLVQAGLTRWDHGKFLNAFADFA